VSAVLNRSHPLAQGLMFATFPGVLPADLVTGAKFVAEASWSHQGVSVKGERGGVSSSTSAGWLSFIQTSLMRTIVRNCSIVVVSDPATREAWSVMLSLPYGPAWSAPYGILHFHQNQTDTKGVFRYVKQTTLANVTATTAATGFADHANDGLTTYGMERTGGNTAIFYRNGVVFGSASLATNADTYFGTGNYNLTLCNRSSTAAGEGYSGLVEFAGIWNRQLGARGQRLAHDNIRGLLTNRSRRRR
jgi:hypothetical protein